MFKKLSIRLSGPICQCKAQDLTWGMISPGIYIKCNSCNTVLNVGEKSLIASFDLDKPYPKGTVKKPELTVIDGGKARRK